MEDEGWAYFLETPPSFDQTPSSQDLPATSPLGYTGTQNADQPEGLVRANPENDSPPTLGPNEMECRVLIIDGLPENFGDSHLRRLITPPNLINRYEQNSNGSVTLEFYDLRNSVQYRQYLEGATFDGNPIEVKYGSARKRTEDGRPANNGTVVLFHLSECLTNRQLSDIFSQYGEIRQIRSTPTKLSQRFIEFWDTRAAAQALEEMSGRFVSGSKISIEFSVPGGMRRKALE